MQGVKRLLVNTPLERPARAVRSLLRRNASTLQLTEWELRTRRDDLLFEQILKESLTTDSNCIDIGAHSGAFLRQFLTFAPSGHHYAFEPIPALASRLRLDFPDVEVLDCALSNYSGRTDFHYVPDLPGWSGLKAQHYPFPTETRTIEVTVRRLDEVLDIDFQVDFMKVDVEGAELNVLEGAEKIIKKWKPFIIFEHAQVHTTEYGTTPNMLFNFLRSCALQVYRLDSRGPLSEEDFARIYHTSFASNYDRHAETNFIARSG